MSSREKELLDDISTITRQMRKMAAEGLHHTNSRAARALRHDLFDARKQLKKLTLKSPHKVGVDILSGKSPWHKASNYWFTPRKNDVFATIETPDYEWSVYRRNNRLFTGISKTVPVAKQHALLALKAAREGKKTYMGSSVSDREGARRRLLKALIDWHGAEHLTKKVPPHYYDKLEGRHEVGLPVLDTGTKDWKEDPFKMGHNQGVGMLTQEQVNRYNVGRWVPRSNGRGWWQPGGGAHAYGQYYPGGGWHAYPSGRIVHNPMSIRGEVGYMDQFASRNPFKMGYDRVNAFKMGVNELEPFKMGHTDINAFKMGWQWNPGGGRYDGRANWHPGGGWRVQPSGSRRHVRPSYVGDTVFAYGEAAPVAAAFKSHPAWAARRAQQRKKIHRLCTLAAQGNPRARYILSVVRRKAAQGNKRALRILRDCAQFAALNKRPQSQTSGCGLAPMDHASTHSLGAAVMAKLSGI